MKNKTKRFHYSTFSSAYFIYRMRFIRKAYSRNLRPWHTELKYKYNTLFPGTFPRLKPAGMVYLFSCQNKIYSYTISAVQLPALKPLIYLFSCQNKIYSYTISAVQLPALKPLIYLFSCQNKINSYTNRWSVGQFKATQQSGQDELSRTIYLGTVVA